MEKGISMYVFHEMANVLVGFVVSEASDGPFLYFRFNDKPKDGIKFLQDRELLRSTPGEVAEWLHTEERLDKAAIGNFLGEPGEFSREVNTE